MDLIKSESKDLSKFICIICNEHKEYYSIGKCNHRVTCMYCTLKCRSFYNDKRCPLCNVILEEIFISPISEEYLFDDLNKNDKSIFFKDDDFINNGVYYVDISSKEESLNLKGFKCPINYCSSDPFDNINLLKKHLSENHLKYYCDVCLKDGKKFLSEQKIFAKEELKFHNKFGDFTQYISPHPKCPFCKVLYYNDELLFKHMSQLHFLCEICKNKEKKIIFYSNLPNLIQHNKIKHYCCPYKECVDNLYVSFGSEQEFIGHLISKHHMNDIGGTLNSMVFENQPEEKIYPEKYDISLSKDEFNFTNYINKLKNGYNKYKEENENKKFIDDYNNKFNYDDIEVEVKYVDNYNKFNNNSNPYFNKNKGKNNKNKEFKQNKNNRNEKNLNDQKEDSLDYEFIIQFFLKEIKNYITERIKIREVKEEEVQLPRETIYQLIRVIDTVDSNRKLLELSSIQNFGIPLESINKIKTIFFSNSNDNLTNLFIEFDNLTMKNMLIIYKYMSISLKKISGFFFKLDIEQIDEDLYEDFIKRKIQKEKKKEYNSNSLKTNNNNNNNNYNKINFEIYKFSKKGKKRKKDKKYFIPGLNGNNNQKMSNIYSKPGNLGNEVKDFNKYENKNNEIKNDEIKDDEIKDDEIKNEIKEDNIFNNENSEEEEEKIIIKNEEEDIKDYKIENKFDDKIEDNDIDEKKNNNFSIFNLDNNNISESKNNNNNFNNKKTFGKKGKKKQKFIDLDQYNK